MFTKLKDDIEFSDLETFCKTWGEGVRVEYKQQITKDIPKIVSSFANTLGGIFIIGVKADQTKNEVIFPIQGIPNPGGLEEQITQSALIGIYPAVMPEVIICDVPNSNNNVVVIVRVGESIQAPHAIQNSTRVYIRTASVTQPYKLEQAEIDRIEYMLKRREDSQLVARQILDRTEERVKSFCSTDRPTLTVFARPVFPYRPIVSVEDVREFAMRQPGLLNVRRITGGVYFMTDTSLGDSYHYSELNEHGVVYRQIVLSRLIQGHGGNWNSKPNDSDEPHRLNFAEFIWTMGGLVRLAQHFYEKCEYLGNVEIAVRLRQVFGEDLLYRQGAYFSDDDQRCADSEVFASIQCISQDLAEEKEFINGVDELVGQLLWAFNVNIGQNQRREYVTEVLKRNGSL